MSTGWAIPCATDIAFSGNDRAHRVSRGRTLSALWRAFTATAAAMLFVVVGAVGYTLWHGVPFTIAALGPEPYWRWGDREPREYAVLAGSHCWGTVVDDAQLEDSLNQPVR